METPTASQRKITTKHTLEPCGLPSNQSVTYTTFHFVMDDQDKDDTGKKVWAYQSYKNGPKKCLKRHSAKSVVGTYVLDDHTRHLQCCSGGNGSKDTDATFVQRRNNRGKVF